MGKGDKKTKKGKISAGSYGISRKKKKKAAYVGTKPKTKKVVTEDAPAAKVSIQYVLDKIEHNNVEAVVCDTSTPSINNDITVIDAIKDKFPAIHILMVGRHVSVLPEETLKKSDKLEAIAIREYEYTVRDWLEAVACGASFESVDGLVWKNNEGEITRNRRITSRNWT